MKWRQQVIEPSSEGHALVHLTQGQVAKIDAAHVGIVSLFRWCASRHHKGAKWYAFSMGGKLAMHRLLLSTGEGMDVDHKNGDGLDNRSANLRPATRAQNKWNVGMPKHNTTGFKGVVRCRDRFQAKATVNGVHMSFGVYATAEEAAAAYEAAVSTLHGEFANTGRK